jgi:hypothetical protein
MEINAFSTVLYDFDNILYLVEDRVIRMLNVWSKELK